MSPPDFRPKMPYGRQNLEFKKLQKLPFDILITQRKISRKYGNFKLLILYIFETVELFRSGKNRKVLIACSAKIFLDLTMIKLVMKPVTLIS